MQGLSAFGRSSHEVNQAEAVALRALGVFPEDTSGWRRSVAVGHVAHLGVESAIPFRVDMLVAELDVGEKPADRLAYEAALLLNLARDRILHPLQSRSRADA